MAESILRLRVDNQEYDAKIKSASEGLQRFAKSAHDCGGAITNLEKNEIAFIRELGSMNTVATTAEGKVRELQKAYRELAFTYKELTDEEKRDPAGKALAASLDELRTRAQNAKKSLDEINREMSGGKFGEFGSIIDSIGKKMGITGNLTDMLTSKTALLTGAVGAGIAVIGEAANKWADYNKEIGKQTGIVRVTTGLQGEDANIMTDSIRAMVDVYNVDFREAVKAANTLISQFGKSGDETIQLLQDGMRGMINGDGNNLLHMIQQYAPAFRDAGIAADQLIAIIHNSQGGIFTPQNMSAIVMGIKNIRLMTDQTREALAKLGIDGQDMAEKMSQCTMTVFDAMRTVMQQLQKVEAGSKTAGEVMQRVFGRQGAAAGTVLAKAIETLNLNLDETKTKTGQVGDAYNDLYDSTVKLNSAIREAFGYDGWNQMAIGIKSKLVSALADVIDKLGTIRNYLGRTNPSSSNTRFNVDKDIANIDQVSTREKRYDVYVRQLRAYEQKVAEIDRVIASVEADVGKYGWNAQHMAPNGQMMSNRQRFNELTANRNRVSDALEDFRKRGYQHVDNPVRPDKKDDKIIPLDIPEPSKGKTDAERAQDNVKKALQDYEQAIQKAALEVEAGRMTDAEAIKKRYAAQLKLWEAYGDAYNIVKDPKYKEAQDATAEEIKKLGGEVTASIEAQKKAQEAARQLEQAQKKLADAQREQADALASGNLKAYNAASEKVTNARADVQRLGGSTTTSVNIQPKIVDSVMKSIPSEIQKKIGTIMLPLQFSLTDNNLQAFITNLKDRLSQAEVGSDLYNNLTAQLADANALAGFIEIAVKNGIDTAQFNPKDLWGKIFGENPGDYIDDAKMEEIRKKMEKLIGKPISLDFNTGDVKVDDKRKEKNEDKLLGNVSKLTSGISSISGGLKSMGVELPEEVNKAINAIQGLMSVIQGVNSVISIFSASTQTANTVAVSTNTVAMTALTSAVVANTTALSIETATNFISPFFAQGGIVPHAAGGWVVPGNDHSDRTMVAVSSGELILNKAQQGNLASLMENGGISGLNLSATISGEQIRLVLNNNGRRTGRGEYVQTNFR